MPIRHRVSGAPPTSVSSAWSTPSRAEDPRARGDVRDRDRRRAADRRARGQARVLVRTEASREEGEDGGRGADASEGRRRRRGVWGVVADER